MNTTAAANQANVTVATIRTWCRIGAVAAIKTAGRWVIDTASLAHRITIGAMKTTPRKPRPVVYSIETMTAIGGNRWQRNGMDRVYLNDWEQFTGIDVFYYNSGNVSSASIDGKSIANSRVGRILGSISKVYFDAADGHIHISHTGADALEIRYLNGDRETLNLVQRIFSGIRSAVAAL